ncbi:N,N-dimethylformamidase beta subunit family domain-containing protein [Hansschlegelia quercus]|uniref:LamG domain-containing protein n=1 Tax=Hansschlegelia quercus TaxID=2528245 RepID=A0A4Q9GMS6_9HYPH|nr:N,N-dimethylformamidase beta subunit family domain-containing protein [Hansschlegelia quercus]TBN52503.1 LamG domain-containing protein [Hansschlegelia quercus]
MLKITGYSDRLYARAGETIDFKINCDDPGEYEAEIVRIVCGDDNPEGPGVKEIPFACAANGRYPARRQEIRAGSYVAVDDPAPLAALKSFTVEAFIWPTTPAKGVQGVIAHRDADAGFALMVDASGCLAIEVGDGTSVKTLSSDAPLLARRWYHVGASFDASDNSLRLFQLPLAPVPRVADEARMKVTASFKPAEAASPVYIAALPELRAVSAFYNGKIDSPRIFGSPLDDASLASLAADAPIATGDPIAAWDFSADMHSQRAVERSDGLHGRVVNFPARAMAGWNWTGEIMDWKQDPSQWGAIHFHDDDIYDAGWETDFSLVIPDDMPSALYAARIRMDGAEEYVPFTVTPAPGKESRIAFLLPYATYMAYANDHLGTDGGNGELLNNILNVLNPPDLFLNEHWEYGGSLYDNHSDGSGICYSSRLRPIVNQRPKTQGVLGGYGGSKLWGLNADTHIIDWLHAMGHAFDVITDEELNDRGVALLEPYAVVITGSHPEYVSTEMWEATRSYLDGGGRLMYLGGDGFYWRVAYHRECPGILELRRAETGVRAWSAEAGEYYQSFDGRYGGLWLRQGRAPQGLVGVGFAAQGFDLSSYYRRTPDSLKAEVQFIFEGIGEDELIGDFGLIGGGAAGLEVDRAAPELGTPPNAYVVASSEAHTNAYYIVPEEFLETGPALGGDENPSVRADMTFFETPNEGAVFSVGSMAWAGSLSHAGYDNNVSRITDNVLRRFLDPTAF